MTDGEVEEQLHVLLAGAIDVVTDTELRAKVAGARPLRVKLGIDPTASDIHLGFAVVLRKLRRFQDFGHTAVLILGDFTARVGDPSGRDVTRPRLSREEIDAHAATYIEQVRQILRGDRLEVRRNSEWLDTMGIEDVLRLTSRSTVARMLERDDFSRRYRDGRPISLTELLYPLFQGWDSVMVEADVELGGTDQLFNNLMGRALQQQEGQDPQVVITMPLLEGIDGVQKMSKSLGNYVAIGEPPEDQFGKLMHIRDELMPRYFALTTAWDPDQVARVTAELGDGTLPKVQAKRLLARTVVDLYHGEGAGTAAEAEFDRVFKAHEAPSEVSEHILNASEAVDGRIRLANVLRQSGLVPSNAEGRRRITQGGVRIDGDAVTDPEAAYTPDELDGATLSVGRRRWVRLRRA